MFLTNFTVSGDRNILVFILSNQLASKGCLLVYKRLLLSGRGVGSVCVEGEGWGVVGGGGGVGGGG